MEKQNKKFGLVRRFEDGAFRPQYCTKKAFGEGVGCRAKAGGFEARDGALQALI